MGDTGTIHGMYNSSVTKIKILYCWQ